MPSDLPRFTLRAEQEILDKMKLIAKANDRKLNQHIVHLLKKDIQDYESQNGVIKIVNIEGNDNSNFNINM